MQMAIQLKSIRNKIQALAESSEGTAAIEFAICFPLFILFFYQYIGFTYNLKLVSNLERATASLGDIFANTKLTEGEPDSFTNTVMGTAGTPAVISDEAVSQAFLRMVGKLGIDGKIKITYKDDESLRERFITVNDGVDASWNADLLANARNKTSEYGGKLIGIEACIKNIAQDYTFFTSVAFDKKYCSVFVTPRSE